MHAKPLVVMPNVHRLLRHDRSCFHGTCQQMFAVAHMRVMKTEHKSRIETLVALADINACQQRHQRLHAGRISTGDANQRAMFASIQLALASGTSLNGCILESFPRQQSAAEHCSSDTRALMTAACVLLQGHGLQSRHDSTSRLSRPDGSVSVGNTHEDHRRPPCPRTKKFVGPAHGCRLIPVCQMSFR